MDNYRQIEKVLSGGYFSVPPLEQRLLPDCPPDRMQVVGRSAPTYGRRQRAAEARSSLVRPGWFSIGLPRQ